MLLSNTPYTKNLVAKSAFWSFSLRLFARSYFYVEAMGQHCHCFSMCHDETRKGQCKPQKQISKAAGSRRREQLLRAVASTALPGLPSWAGRAFRLSQFYKQKMPDLPWMSSLCTQPPAWQGQDACWKEMPGDLWKSALLVLPGFYPASALGWADPSLPRACAQGWQCVSLGALPTNIPVKPSKLWAKEGALYPLVIES